MREFNHKAQTPLIGIDIGYDFFRYGWQIGANDELSKMPEPLLKPIKAGFETAQLKKMSKLHSLDYFDKKLLNIRARAYRKGIEVTISKDDLICAYEQTDKKCPVLRKELTFSTNEPTDLSVDRVDNMRGYLPDNIIILSAKVNEAKGSITLAELMVYCSNYSSGWFDYEKYPAFRALKPLAWMMLHHNMVPFMSDELIDRTSLEVITEIDRAFKFISMPFLMLLYHSCCLCSHKKVVAHLKKSATMRRYIDNKLFTDKDIKVLRKQVDKIFKPGISSIKMLPRETGELLNNQTARPIIERLIDALQDDLRDSAESRVSVIKDFILAKNFRQR